MQFLIAYASQGGNTQAVAFHIRDVVVAAGHEVTMNRMETDSIPNLQDFDALIIGSYTIRKGSVPEIAKTFARHTDYKPQKVYVFGTGDTQFGGDTLFCLAADKLARFYASDYPVLKIEQAPRGSQILEVIEWAKGVVNIDKITESSGIGAVIS